MLKLRIALIAILITCITFVSCDRAQNALKPADMVAGDDMMTGDDMMATDDMMMDMMKMLDSTMYMSWAHVMLLAPVPMADATSPAETGAAHNPPPIDGGALTARTVYINDIGAMANKAGAAAYPAGTVIVKEIMDKTETFVDKVAVMMKSDDPMYAGHNGWVYKKYLRPSADGEYMQIAGSNKEDAANGCHGCHAKATNDSVFVALPMDDMGDDMTDDMTGDMTGDDMTGDMTGDDMTDDMTDDGMEDMTDDMTDDGMEDMTGDMAGGNGNGAGDGADAGAGNGNGAGDGADAGNGDGAQ